MIIKVDPDSLIVKVAVIGGSKLVSPDTFTARGSQAEKPIDNNNLSPQASTFFLYTYPVGILPQFLQQCFALYPVASLANSPLEQPHPASPCVRSHAVILGCHYRPFNPQCPPHCPPTHTSSYQQLRSPAPQRTLYTNSRSAMCRSGGTRPDMRGSSDRTRPRTS